MRRRPPRSTRTDTLFPYAPLFRSRGHQIVIAEAAAQARRLGVPVTVLSFEPHPRSVFRSDDPPLRLTPFRIRARLLEALGAAAPVFLHFDELFSRTPSVKFVCQVSCSVFVARLFRPCSHSSC